VNIFGEVSGAQLEKFFLPKQKVLEVFLIEHSYGHHPEQGEEGWLYKKAHTSSSINDRGWVQCGQRC
jgi:hypothetical protein